jgi:FkbM family methyltransferase
MILRRAGKRDNGVGAPARALPGMYTDGGLTFLWEYLLAHQNAPERFSIDQNAVDFLAHCLDGFLRSKAQLLQDLYVTYKLGGKRDGFFVEFGATDGILLSNTYHLEKSLGWDGILAEPLPRWREPLRSNRSAEIDYRCVWRNTGKELEFLAANRYPELSSLKTFSASDFNASFRLVDSEIIKVKTISLNDLLLEHDAPAMIDYVSIDTEGSEFDILNSFDFDKFKIRVMTVEHNYQSNIRESVHRLLESKGFVREFEIFSKWDDWYFHPGRI